MEHYVRTKDGVYEIKGANLITKSFTIYKGKRQCFIKEKDIIDQSDTIEELAEFVAVKFEWEDLPSVHSLKELYKKAEEKGWDKNQVFDNHKFLIERSEKTHSVEYIKYAIATDKGLIYVAKMNEKGELELL